MTLKISSHKATAIKICGITKVKQSLEIASLGADAIGVIGVKSSPRFVDEKDRRDLFKALELEYPEVERVWVVANNSNEEIAQVLDGFGTPSIIQLHGDEPIERCQELKKTYSNIKWWKAFRAQTEEDLLKAKNYEKIIDAILIDAWDQNVLGGSGERVPIDLLKKISFEIPWWIAGGICAEWIKDALNEINPHGIDASSKLEKYPGIKDLEKVKSLIEIIKNK